MMILIFSILCNGEFMVLILKNFKDHDISSHPKNFKDHDIISYNLVNELYVCSGTCNSLVFIFFFFFQFFW